MKYFKSINKNPYFIIAFVYYLANFMLPLLSGCWWDDWTFMSHDLEYVNMVASQSGRPEWNILIPLCWSLTNNGRILIFLLYLFDSLFVYSILSNSDFFDKKASLIIALLFTVIPVNDARLLISNFPYAVGLFFFYLALMLFIKWNNTNNKKIFYRIIILALFLVSFILTSLLAYYYIIFIYLFIIDVHNNKEINIIKRITISIKNVLLKYIDFFVLPFVFFVVNKVCFPVTGDFTGRSLISLSGLLKTIKYVPLTIIYSFKSILSSVLECVQYWPVIVALLISLLIVFFKTNSKAKRKISLLYLLFGIIVLILGIFIYVEVRGKTLTITGVKGRDAILMPLGISIILFYLFSLFNEKIKNTLCVSFIVLGIFSMNILYAEWQKDYYYQLSMEYLFDNDVIEENDTFYVVDLNESDINGQRYYSLNTNAYHTFGDQSRFFIPEVYNLYILKSKDSVEEAKSILNYSHMMKDYEPDDYNLDAVLIYNADLSLFDVIELKYYELFNQDVFNRLIETVGTMDIVEVNDEFTDVLLEKISNGQVSDDYDVEELLKLYYNY